jgi:hypothetical protein
VKQWIMRSITGERPVHILLLGPPDSSKSLFLLEISRIWGAKYYLSTSSTKAGIQRYLKEGIEGLKDKPRTKEREATEAPSRYHHSDKEGASRE